MDGEAKQATTARREAAQEADSLLRDKRWAEAFVVLTGGGPYQAMDYEQALALVVAVVSKG